MKYGDKVLWFGYDDWSSDQDSHKGGNAKDCWHDYKEYIGIREHYMYCTKCDKKAKPGTYEDYK